MPQPGPELPPLVDLEVLGRHMRAARTIRGFDRMSDVSEALEAQFALKVSPRTLYAIEQGKQMPNFELALCLLAVLTPGQPNALFDAAIRRDLLDVIYNG